jgi:hypothetical protein
MSRDDLTVHAFPGGVERNKEVPSHALRKAEK